MKKSQFFLNVLMVLIGVEVTGCGLARAPDVDLPKKAEPSLASLGIESLCSDVELETRAPNCGVVELDLKSTDESKEWIYWTAGQNNAVYDVAPEFLASLGWDMRVHYQIPIIGSNGGQTAVSEKVTGAKAAFALWREDPAARPPQTVVQMQDLVFVDDRYEGLKFQGVSLESMYQNPVVNTIGSGILSGYEPQRHHAVTLSRRIFILRSADGLSYFAIRFIKYSRSPHRTSFEWRKL